MHQSESISLTVKRVVHLISVKHMIFVCELKFSVGKASHSYGGVRLLGKHTQHPCGDVVHILLSTNMFEILKTLKVGDQ